MGMVLENGVWILKSDSPWTVEHEVDFARLEDHDFTTEANTYSINGVTWSASSGDISETTKFEIEKTVGLEIDPKPATAYNWYSSGRQAPVFSAKGADLGSNIKDDDTIAFQLKMSGNTLTGNYQAFGMGIFDGSGTIAGDASASTNANGFVCARNFYESSKKTIGAIRNDKQDKYFDEQGDFFEIIWYPNVSFYIAVGTIGSADFSDPQVVYTYQGYLAMELNFGSDSAPVAASQPTYGYPDWDIHRPDHSSLQARVGIFAAGQTSANQLETNATKFRILRRRRT